MMTMSNLLSLENVFYFPSLFTYHHLPPWWTWARTQRNTALSRISAAGVRARAAPPGSHCEGWPAFGSWTCDCFFWDPRWTRERHSLRRRRGVQMKPFFSATSCEFYCNQILHNGAAEEVHRRTNRGYHSARERHKESKTEKNWNQNKCEKWESGCWVELSNEQLERWALCHPSTATYHSQASICVPTTTPRPIFFSSITLTQAWTNTQGLCVQMHVSRSVDTHKACAATHQVLSHSIWFVISLGALIISRYLGHWSFPG